MSSQASSSVGTSSRRIVIEDPSPELVAALRVNAELAAPGNVINARIGAINARIGENNARIDGINARIGENNARIGVSRPRGWVARWSRRWPG